VDAGAERPPALPDDESVVYAFSTELLERQQVSDTTWARATAALGEQGAVDLVAINGYYAYLALLMNAARTPAPATGAPPLPPRR
jgi:4-carboxymuconolactone decarboxylase